MCVVSNHNPFFMGFFWNLAYIGNFDVLGKRLRYGRGFVYSFGI